MADDFGSGLDMNAGDLAPAQPGFGSAVKSLLGPQYTQAAPDTSPLDASANLLQQRIKRAQGEVANPIWQMLAPDHVKSEADFITKSTEQLQTIEQQRQHAADVKTTARNWGITNPNQFGAQATDTTLANEALRQWKDEGNFNAYKALSGTSPEWKARADLYMPEAMGVFAKHVQGVQDGIAKLNSAAEGGEQSYQAARKALIGSPDLASIGVKPGDIPETRTAWQQKSSALMGQYNNAQRTVSAFQAQQDRLHQAAPVTEEKVAKQIEGTYQFGNGEAIPGFNAVSLPGYGDVQGVQGPPKSKDRDNFGAQGPQGWHVGTPEQIKSISEDVKNAVPKEDLEKSRNFNRTYRLATTDASGNPLPAGRVNTNPNVQQGMAESLASMLRGGSGGANVGLLKIETNKRGFIQGLIDKIETEKAAAINELKGKDVEPYLSKLTQNQIRDVMDVLKQYTGQSIAERTGGIAERAGRYGIPLDKLGLDKDVVENPGFRSAYDESLARSRAELKSYSMVPIGDRAVLLPPGSSVKGAMPPQESSPPAVPLPKPGSGPGRDVPLPTAGPGPSPAMTSVASRYGIAPADLARTVQIESGGNPRAVTGSYKGLTQISDAEFNKYKTRPDASIWNAQDNLEAGAAKMQAEGNQFAKNFGRPPSGFDTYMIHQQGLAGYSHHLADPEAPAWQNMAATGEGKQKGDGWARRAIWDNIPDQYKASFGNVNNVTSRDFLAMWQQKWAGGKGAAPNEGPPGNPPLNAAATDPRLAALRSGSRGARRDTPQDREAVQTGVVEHAPAIGSTIGALGGGVAAGPAGAVAGGGAGGAAGQSLKDYLLGNAQSPTQIAKQGALGAVLGVAPEGRPVVGALARTLGAGGVEAGGKAAEGGDTADVVEAGLTGTAAAAGGEAFGRALGMAGHKIYSLFTGDAQKTVRAAAADLHAANETLKTEQPKLPGAAGASVANPKYEAAEKVKEKAELTIKEMMPNAKPDEVAYAHKVSSEGVPTQEAQASRPGAAEKESIGAGYRQIESDVGAAGRGAPKASPKLSDGPLAAVENKQVSAKHAELAQRVEMEITKPAANWQEKWTQLKDARTALLDAERDALTSTAPGRTQTAKDMRTLADTVRAQQVKAANYVFGSTKGAEVIDKLKMLDTRYRRLMDATNGGDLGAAARMKGEAGRVADRAFRAFAHDDPVAVAAWSAMRGNGPDVEKDIRTMIGAEKIPVLGHLVSAVKLLAGMNQWRAERAAGSVAKFEDFVPELKDALSRRARTFRDVGGSAGARAAMDVINSANQPVQVPPAPNGSRVANGP